MPRPCKRRRICAEPPCRRFAPGECAGGLPPITMTVDEYECIRLIDHMHLTQEQCARQMAVARTTVQAIYACARSKLAACLVQGRELMIDGGEYQLCDGSREHCGCQGRCCARSDTQSALER